MKNLVYIYTHKWMEIIQFNEWGDEVDKVIKIRVPNLWKNLLTI